jgi:hypothetical protein
MSASPAKLVPILLLMMVSWWPGCTNVPAAPAGTTDASATIAGAPWQTVSLTFDGRSVSDEGARTMQFHADGRYVTTLQSGESIEGTWTLVADDTQLMLDEGAMEESVFDIDELTATRLGLSWTGVHGTQAGRYEYRGKR